MASSLLTVVCVLLAVTPVVVSQQQAEIVETTLGLIQGLRQTVKGQSIGRNGDVPVDVYYGIPFAKPPVGNLRFKHPQPADTWTGVKSTVTKPNSCHQTLDTQFNRFIGVEMWNPNTPMSEDCLYLNVWVPRGFDQPPKATMVWIFGGGFWAGTSTLDVYDGANLAATENVIVISLNYRLGALGFLYSASDKTNAPGNQGLLDQVMALKWIHDNVAKFGGLQETITIFGESAGAVSVGFHLMSPLSRNYFSRAIMQSASPVANWGVRSTSQSHYRTQKLSDILCPSSTSPLSCLLQADPQNITDAMWQLNSFYFEVPFAPIVDEHFLPEHPKVLLETGQVKDTDIVIGVNKDEGMFWLLYGFPDQFPLNITGNMSKSEMDEVVHGINFKREERLDKAILYEYVDSVLPQDRDSYRDVADDISGDDLFKCPVVNFASAYQALRHTHNVYVYSFEHRLSNNPWPAWTGVLHGYEIEAMFALPNEYNYTLKERALASRVTGYWTRFAHTGDPNGQESVQTWPKMTRRGLEYLQITAQGDNVRHGLRHSQCSFRKHVLPLLEDGTPPAIPTSSSSHSTLAALTATPLELTPAPSVCGPLAASISAAI
ncbi:acetylcholinesterase-like isoform X2 [Babylonia areolata]|uniref:acetylcholinesterase-like isoform X2 n=1 Tax=Babylonia areolata TaxID=304850 RepID=UPI003FD22BCB